MNRPLIAAQSPARYQFGILQFLVPVTLLMFMVALLARPVMPAWRMVVQHAMAAYLPPAVKNADRQQDTAGGTRENLAQAFVHLKPEPRNAQSQQRGQQHVAHARQRRNRQGLRPAPAASPRHEDKGQPVRRQCRMKKRHRKPGKGDSRKDRIIHG
jgi:hypothetical protein